MGTNIAFSAITSAALHLVPGFSLLPVQLRSAAGMLMSDMLINERFKAGINGTLKRLQPATQRRRSLDMGRGFNDSQSVSSLRTQAVMEMGNALGTSRSVLGQEARFLHS